MIELLARHRYLYGLVTSTLMGLGVYVACALVVVSAELWHRRDMSVYRTPNAFNDLAYVVFYQCSIYNLLVAPLFAILAPRLQFLRFGLMARLPMVFSFIACWFIFDFLNYWVHRLQHSVRPLWAFHSVHHAQTRMTFLSSNRIHAVEQLYVSALMIVPAFILGIPQPRWLPILLLQVFSETMQHARLNWSFGPMHRLVVSPLFHSVHHS
ncbi:MAG: fatty acid hydroxylase, partial [Acidobacteria bacterium]|nr:fatty acid hydroxylase [Acidobacteriota bacterium]